MLASLLFIFIFFISLVVTSAQGIPQQLQNDVGITINYPKYEYIKQFTDFTLHLHVENQTKVLTTASHSCIVHLYGTDGSHTTELQMGMDSNGLEYEIPISGYNFTNLGIHAYIIVCNNSNQVGSASGSFEVTPNGIQNTFGFYIAILILSLGIIIFGFAINDGWVTILGSFGLYFISLYILFNGFVGVRDATTQGIGLVVLGVAMYVSIKAIYDMLTD